MRKQRWRISGKPSFRLAAVANERINSGHAQREREAFQALWEQGASFFFGVRIRLGTILGRFSMIYFRGLGLRIRVRVWVRARARARVWVRVRIGVWVRVSIVLWSW